MPASDRSLTGKTCLVTGATDGVGKVTARALAEQGAHVLLVGRDPDKTEQTTRQIREQTGSASVQSFLADLSSQKQVRRLAEEVLSRHERLDVLVNNAGALFLTRQESQDGIEMTLALNHLGYFLLTHLLLDRLRQSAPARIVNVASEAHQSGTLDLEDLEGRRRYSGWGAYCQSKLANVMFTYSLARRLEGTGVTANALHPGFVATGFGSDNGWRGALMRPFIRLFGMNVERGARTQIHLAGSPEVEGKSGLYWVKCRPARSSRVSHEEAAGERLWQLSAQMTGVAA
jgi:NAD(P)-dependent dehydrogenase (short-subunit alcohol dehydrogenase family)